MFEKTKNAYRTTVRTIKLILGAALVIFIGVTAYVLYDDSKYPKDPAPVAKKEESKEPKLYSVAFALTDCQLAIKSIVKDPANTKVPFVKSHGDKYEHYFAWGVSTKHIQTRNGLGNEVAATASCIVDARTKKIIQLTFNGKEII